MRGRPVVLSSSCLSAPCVSVTNGSDVPPPPPPPPSAADLAAVAGESAAAAAAPPPPPFYRRYEGAMVAAAVEGAAFYSLGLIDVLQARSWHMHIYYVHTHVCAHACMCTRM